MDTALIVFIIGTVASFLPMYWIALRLIGRQRTKRMTTSAKVGGIPAGRREFFDLLRQEAAQRAVSALQDALDEVGRAAGRPHEDYPAISMRSRQSLHDAGRLVDSLFQRELSEAFRRAAEVMTTATPGSIARASGAATNAISAFERAIDAARNAPVRKAPSPQSLWSALRNRRRGWIGAGDVRAAA